MLIRIFLKEAYILSLACIEVIKINHISLSSLLYYINILNPNIRYFYEIIYYYLQTLIKNYKNIFPFFCKLS